jgi:hypothetical protein
MDNTNQAPIEEWTASELFHYLQNTHIIAPEEQFEDWKHDRTDMIKMVRDNEDPKLLISQL